jgi:hypothetical protein
MIDLETSLHKQSACARKYEDFILALNLTAIGINLTFPKMGFYYGFIPINIGYVFLAIGVLALIPKLLLRAYRLTINEIVALFFLVCNGAFQLISLKGLGSEIDRSLLFGHVISVALIPPLALLSTGYVLRFASRIKIYRLMLWSLGIICVFGIVNFLGLNVYRRMIGIPFFTYTGTDFDISTKYIDRGGVVKLISSYNNGNIFGVNVLIWSNLALFAYPKVRLSSKRVLLTCLGVLVRVALLLTLSRTVWIAMIFNEIYLRVFVSRRLNQILSVFFVLLILVVFVYGAARLFVDDPVAFVFDANLGARREQLNATWGFWPAQPFSGTAEIVYASMVANFGVIGLGLFVLTWAWPAFIPPVDYEGRLVQMGLFVYLLMLGADGAFIYVPTQATYWFLASFALQRSRTRSKVVS